MRATLTCACELWVRLAGCGVQEPDNEGDPTVGPHCSISRCQHAAVATPLASLMAYISHWNGAEAAGLGPGLGPGSSQASQCSSSSFKDLASSVLQASLQIVQNCKTKIYRLLSIIDRTNDLTHPLTLTHSLFLFY